MASPSFLSFLSFLRIAKAGLTARGIVYGLIALLLLKAALLPGTQDRGFSPQDAFSTLETTLLGRGVLIVIATGLGLYAIWRWLQAFADTSDKGTSIKGLLARTGMVMSGNSYALVGLAALLTTLGQNAADGGGGSTKKFVAWLLEQPFGHTMTFIAGVILIGIGCAQVWRVKSAQWRHSIDMDAASDKVVPIIQFAIIGRGLLFILMGLFIVVASQTGQSSDAKGLAESLSWLRAQPFGFWLYLISALILLAYGIYSLTQARHTQLG